MGLVGWVAQESAEVLVKKLESRASFFGAALMLGWLDGTWKLACAEGPPRGLCQHGTDNGEAVRFLGSSSLPRHVGFRRARAQTFDFGGKPRMTTLRRAFERSPRIAALVLLLVAPAAWAAEATSQPQGVVGLSASATSEVTKDLLSVTLSTTRDGTSAGEVQAALKQALDAALAEAKKAAKPGEIEVQTGNFSLFPRYTNKGVISGWQGTAELQVEGRDVPGIAQLTGRITTLTIARVGARVSRQLQEKVESELAAQAIARYRAKAAEYAKHFGYRSFAIREVNVGSNEPVAYAAAPMMRSAQVASSGEALPVELGKGTVTVNVNGSVQLTN